MSLDLDNIVLGLNKEVSIDQLIIWLERRKEKGYSTIKPTFKEGEIIIELVVMKTELTKEEIEKLKSDKEKQMPKIIKK